MNVIVVGAGEVGFHIADRLSKEGHNVTVIEKSAEKERVLKAKLNALVVRGSGAGAETLEQAGIGSAELFIAVTNQDEVNMVACLLANEYNVPRMIARIKSLEYTTAEWAQNAKKLGIDVLINPQNVVAHEVHEIVSYTAATEAAEFAGGRVVFLGYLISRGSPLAGITLKELGGLRGLYRMVVTAIVRKHETIIPRGEDAIQEGDLVYFVCNRRDVPAINYLFGFEKEQSKNIFILGGGRIGAALAQKFSSLRFRVKIIDRDHNQCQQLAEDLENVTVIHAEGTDIDALRNEGLAQCDVYVAVTDDEQSNILCSLLAKSYGAKRAIALVNRHELLTLAPSLGVDACVSPRLATAAAVLKSVRRGQVAGIATLEQSDAEVLEMVMPAENGLLRQPLKDVELPRGAIIGAIVRGDTVVIPSGEDRLEPADHVIVFALPNVIHDCERLFS
ncbi:MAG: Trk system potassium transporter TrkA [Gemmataceae bacterium]|nr:Trk system potassium transporter TrkA [Gemmataceae bacterium]